MSVDSETTAEGLVEGEELDRASIVANRVVPNQLIFMPKQSLFCCAII
jgi:hypothetical protein